MSILEKIDGSDAFKIKTKIIDDRRGNFCKIFQDSYFDELGGFQPKESYISLSKKGVLRGFHLQVNEVIHGKIITCLAGEILDVFVEIFDVFAVTLVCELLAMALILSSVTWGLVVNVSADQESSLIE